jgi:hypothetical protein
MGWVKHTHTHTHTHTNTKFSLNGGGNTKQILSGKEWKVV